MHAGELALLLGGKYVVNPHISNAGLERPRVKPLTIILWQQYLNRGFRCMYAAVL